LQDARLKEQSVVEKEQTTSIFDKVLAGNLLILDGKRLKRFESKIVAEKYYIFYYTASSCPPCQQFTPTLVNWYKENKNDNFELILISSDENEDAMKNYAVSKMMPWPQLKLNKNKKFESLHRHKVRGIPSLIVCRTNGENLGNYRSRLNDLRNLVK
jgi:nucleoredoxin